MLRAAASPKAVAARLAAYAPHADEVAAIVCCSPDDPAGARTLRWLAADSDPSGRG